MKILKKYFPWFFIGASQYDEEWYLDMISKLIKALETKPGAQE